jgi:hemerythrin
MDLIPWDESYRVGVPVIDEDHRKLFALINELFAAIAAGAGADQVAAAFEDLVLYTRVHFGREEQFMAKAGYPGLAVHKAAHERLVARVLEFYRRHLAGGETAGIEEEARRFLTTWLVSHVLEEDMDYRPWFARKE